jgi:hypothetical protein
MSIANHIAAFTNALGSSNPDIVLALAQMDWQSEKDRNQFIDALVKLNGNQRIG